MTNRAHDMHARAALITMLVFLLSSCNGSSSDPMQTLTTDASEQLTEAGESNDTNNDTNAILTEALTQLEQDSPASGGAGLVVETVGDCSTAGDTITMTLYSRDADVGIPPSTDSDQTGNNVTAYTEFALDSDSTTIDVDIISHTESQIDLVIPSPDIASITASFAGNSVTDFVAAWPAEAPESALLIAQRSNGVCLYSMRVPGFCGTTRSTNAPSQMSFADYVLEFTGCTMTQMPNLPVFRTE